MSNALINSINSPAIILPSAIRTSAVVDSEDFTNLLYRGGQFIIRVSAYTQGNYTPYIQGKDPVSGVYYTLLQGVTFNVVGTQVLTIYPGLAVIANSVASNLLPRIYHLRLIGSSPITPIMTLSCSATLFN